MKYVLIFGLLFCFSHADEIQRINSIINDIGKLRQKNESCQKNSNLESTEKINQLKNKINKYIILVSNRDKTIQKLKKVKKSSKKNNSYKIKNFDNPNKFPKLILKGKYFKYKIVKIKSTKYRLNAKANIYDSVNGKIIKSWEIGNSFSTNKKAILKNKDSWFKITEFLVDGNWIKSKFKMWIKSKYTDRK